MAWPTGFRACTGHGGLREHGDDISIVTVDTDIAPGSVTVRFGDAEVYPGEPEADTLDKLVGIMRQDEVDIVITLGVGEAEATVYGCDLSAGYIRINADYTT
ncbi:bifunctional ornithine acetyltransferase/N-acetylglutamate synthase [Streptomyces uncialis]|uniref:bifunctional ornithine acetyltransferase/N-acetylglutamate synthase n=1 Tax=Streptomyces uncialis TaxID=1048205 RepID=UPI002E307CBC|nr:bifunctional ornithine acetyltransferase/N-acetylglutamate synthase [Streptomyces uncialis]